MKKVLKKLLAVALVAMFTINAVGCGKEENALSKIKASGKIVLGTSPDYPPFEFVISEDGKSKVVGADIELAKKIADKIGVKLEIKSMDFDSLLPALQSGKVDMVITGMTPDETRRKAVDFSDIYFKGENSVIVKASNVDKIKSEEDLKKLKLGVQKGSTQETYVKDKLKKDDYKALKAVPNLVMDLKSGKIDAIVLNSKVANISQGKYNDVKTVKGLKLTSGGEEEAMAIAVKKGDNKELLKLMNEEIKELETSGEYDKILANAVEEVSKEKN